MLGNEKQARPWQPGGVVCFVVSFALVAAWGAGRTQPFTGDEVIILSVSESLVQRGQLGAPVFRGVARAEDHYFLSLPLVHLLHWPVMKVAGVGVVQARMVSVTAATATIALAAWLAWRCAGPAAAALCAGLLVLWRSNVLGIGWGVPLLSVARSGRYDAVTAALLVAVLLILERWLRAASPRSCVLLGVVAGAATLTHFLGAIALPTILLAWLMAGHNRPRLLQLALVYGVFAVTVLPYALYVALYSGDAMTQLSLVHASRAMASFGGIRAVLHNLASEPQRYATLLAQPTPGPLLFAALPLMLFWLYRESGRPGAPVGMSAILACLLASLGFLAAFEPTKAPLYALPLVAPVSVALSILLSGWIRGAKPARRTLVFLLLFVAGTEGTVSYVLDWQAAAKRRSYEELAQELVNFDGAVTGPTRWWWALRDRPYEAFPTLVLRWRSRPDRATSFASLWQEAGFRYVLRTEEFDADVSRSPAEVRSFVMSVMQQCGSTIQQITDPTYGLIQLLRVDTVCSRAGKR